MLDTDAFTHMRTGRPSVVDRLRAASAVTFSVVVVGELIAGFHGGTRLEQNLRDLDEFLALPHVRLTPVTAATADRYGRISADLRRKGRPVPQNDMWIAAQAMETGALLLSFDAHFKEIDGLFWRRLS